MECRQQVWTWLHPQILHFCNQCLSLIHILFTRKIGIGTLLVSIGILVMPIINLISHSELGYYIGLILIVVGVFYIIFILSLIHI